MKNHFADTSGDMLKLFHDGNKQIHDSSKPHSSVVLKRNNYGNLDHENGIHPLDSLQRRFPFYVLIKAASQSIAVITEKNVKGQHDEKAKASNEVLKLSNMLTYINTEFSFNEDLSMRFVRARKLLERAKWEIEMEDLESASTDCSEALNYDPSLLNCYLMKARIEKRLKNYLTVGERKRVKCVGQLVL